MSKLRLLCFAIVFVLLFPGCSTSQKQAANLQNKEIPINENIQSQQNINVILPPEKPIKPKKDQFVERFRNDGYIFSDFEEDADTVAKNFKKVSGKVISNRTGNLIQLALIYDTHQEIQIAYAIINMPKGFRQDNPDLSTMHDLLRFFGIFDKNTAEFVNKVTPIVMKNKIQQSYKDEKSYLILSPYYAQDNVAVVFNIGVIPGVGHE